MGTLKAFADERDVAMVVVHHTRKMGDGDVFNPISDSNGLMGCADETMVLRGQASILYASVTVRLRVYEMGYLLDLFYPVAIWTRLLAVPHCLLVTLEKLR